MSEKGLLYLQDNVSDKEVKIQGNTYKENSLGFTCNSAAIGLYLFYVIYMLLTKIF